MSRHHLSLITHRAGALECNFLMRRSLFSLLPALALGLFLLAPAFQPARAAQITETTQPTQEPGTIEYVVKAGDTVWGIAVEYHSTIASIVALNDLDPEKPVIWLGEKLKVQPGYTATPTQAPTAAATDTPAPTATFAPSDTPQPSATPVATQPAEPIAGTGGGGSGIPLAGGVSLAAGLLLGVAYLFMARATSPRRY